MFIDEERSDFTPTAMNRNKLLLGRKLSFKQAVPLTEIATTA